MAVADVHQLHGVLINNDSFTDEVLIGGLTSQSINTGSEVIKEVAAGDVYPEVAHLNARNVGAAFTTTHVDVALKNLGLRGLCIDGGDNEGFLMYGRRHICPGPDPASRHRTYQMKDGLLLPRTLSVSHQGNAALSVEMIAIQGSMGSSLMIADNQSAQPIPSDTDRFTMGPMRVATNAFDGKKSVSMDFGITAQVEGADSDIEPTWAGVTRVEPIVTVTGVEIVEWFQTINAGNPVHANSEFYLRKRGFADADAQHIKITFNGTSYVPTVFDSSGTSPATTTVIIETVKDPSTAPVVITHDVAIT